MTASTAIRPSGKEWTGYPQLLCERCSWPHTVCPCVTDAHDLAAARLVVEARHMASVARAWMAVAEERAERMAMSAALRRMHAESAQPTIEPSRAGSGELGPSNEAAGNREWT